MNETPPFELYNVFVAVAEEESFSNAAKKLGVSKGTVSRAIARLEEHLGVELLHRTTHAVAMSSAGVALFERVACHVGALRNAATNLPDAAEEPAGLLRITAPHDIGVALLPDLMSKFALRHPDVRFDLHLSNERMDLVADRFDIAFRATRGTLDDSSLQVRKLGSFLAYYYASPLYLSRRGEPRVLGDPGHEWIQFGPSAGDDSARFRVNDFFAVKNLVLHGAGIGLLTSFLAGPHIAQGEVVRVLADLEVAGTGGLYLLYPSSGQVSPKVAAFRDFIVERFGAVWMAQ